MDFFKSVGKSMDSSFTSHKDSDEFFETNKFFIVHYNAAYGQLGHFASVLSRYFEINASSSCSLYLYSVKDAKSRSEVKVKHRMSTFVHQERIPLLPPQH